MVEIRFGRAGTAGDRRGVVERSASRWGAVVLATLVAATPAVGGAADLAVPAGVQATLAVRILEYDRGLKRWSGGRVTVGVVARRAAAGAALAEALAGRDAQGIPIRVVEHAYKDAAELRAWIERSGVRLVYVAADLGSDSTAAVATASARGLPSIVPTRDQFSAGATVGLIVRDGKPHILVNLPGSRAAGMDLDPKLLQLSEVVR